MEDQANTRQWTELCALMKSNPIAAQQALEAASGVCFFSVEQALQLVSIVRMVAGNRVLAIVPLLSRLVDPVKIVELFAILSDEELDSLKSRVGDDLFHFNPRNPTGHYQLDLSTKYVSTVQLCIRSFSCGARLLGVNVVVGWLQDWVVAQSLCDFASEERMYLLKMEILPQVDFSQRQDGEIWRNATLSYQAKDPLDPRKKIKVVEPLEFNSAFKLPNKGVLDVDFTSTNRPSRKAQPIAEHVLANLIKYAPNCGKPRPYGHTRNVLDRYG
jgi:hypothetical protein